MIRVMFDVGIIFRGLMQKDHFFGYLFWILVLWIFFGHFSVISGQNGTV